MATTSININIDEDLITQAKSYFEEIGTDIATAITDYLENIVYEQKTYGENVLSAEIDPFLIPYDRDEWLMEAVAQREAGTAKFYTLEEVIADMKNAIREGVEESGF